MGSPRKRKKPQKPAGNQGSGKGRAWREVMAGGGNFLHASQGTGGLEAGPWQGPPTSSPGQESTAGLQDEAGSVGRPEVVVAWPWWQWCGVAADEATQRCGGLGQGYRERGDRMSRASGLSVGPLPSIQVTPGRFRRQRRPRSQPSPYTKMAHLSGAPIVCNPRKAIKHPLDEKTSLGL